MSGVSTPRWLRQRSRTCWIRSSVHELWSSVCIIFYWGRQIEKKAKLVPLMLWSLLVSGLFSRSDFPLMVLATLYNHCLSLSRPTLALTSKQQVSNQCPQQGKKNTADWHFLVMPVSHRLREWTGDELVENSSTTSTFSFLKSAGDTTFMWLTSKLEITYKRTTSYLSLFSPKSSKCVTLK